MLSSRLANGVDMSNGYGVVECESCEIQLFKLQRSLGLELRGYHRTNLKRSGMSQMRRWLQEATVFEFEL